MIALIQSSRPRAKRQINDGSPPSCAPVGRFSAAVLTLCSFEPFAFRPHHVVAKIRSDRVCSHTKVQLKKTTYHDVLLFINIKMTLYFSVRNIQRLFVRFVVINFVFLLFVFYVPCMSW